MTSCSVKEENNVAVVARTWLWFSFKGDYNTSDTKCNESILGTNRIWGPMLTCLTSHNKQQAPF